MTAIKRALVLSGGGAKGVFEGGCLHAFKTVGLDFDIVTGSSIGALNAAFVGEYTLRRRRPLLSEIPPDNLFDNYLDVWENLEEAQFADAETLEGLIRDLQKVNIGLDTILRIWWGLTDENTWDRVKGYMAAAWALWQVNEILGLSLTEGYQLYQQWLDPTTRPQAIATLRECGRVFLRRHGIEKSLFNSDSIRQAICYGTAGKPAFIPPDRSLREYYEVGVDVRFTRANVRTGRLELSGYVPLDDALRALAQGPDKAANTIIGDPNVVDAALASGALPLGFSPISLRRIYPEGSRLNDLLWAIIHNTQMVEPYLNQEQASLLRSVYPHANDIYLDGGAIDNSPLSAAFRALKDAVARAPSKAARKRLLDATHEVFVVFLTPKPRVLELNDAETADLMGWEIAWRALKMQDHARFTNDVRNAERVTTLLEMASGWHHSERPDRVKANVIQIWPEEMLATTLSFDKRFGFNRQNNHRLLAQGCWCAMDALIPLSDTGRLPDDVTARLKALVERPASGATTWRCRHETCRFRDVCQRV